MASEEVEFVNELLRSMDFSTMSLDEQRAAMTDGFQKRYPNIKVDYSLMASGAHTPKLLAEHSANKVQTDMLVSGVAGSLPLIEAGALADLHPYLLGPDLDESKQLGGKWHFADNAGQYFGPRSFGGRRCRTCADQFV